jgi:hypothetical protein
MSTLAVPKNEEFEEKLVFYCVLGSSINDVTANGEGGINDFMATASEKYCKLLLIF